MNFKIPNETSTLRKVIVGLGHSIPLPSSYHSDSPEYTKYHNQIWDKNLLIKQQKIFFSVLKKYDVKLLHTNINKDLPWQMYTRDTGFVIRDKFFFCNNRGLPDRKDEIKEILHHFKHYKKENIIEIKTGKIEGGDVIISKEEIFIGVSSRTSIEAIKQVEKEFKVKRLHLGKNVMHLDTRLTLLPKNVALIYPESFTKKDFEYLNKKYDLIELNRKDGLNLASNVFVINPNVIVVNKAHKKVQNELKKRGFIVETVDYSEPIALAGSFRCTTLPILREN